MDLLVNCSSAMGQAQSLENMTAKLSDFKEQVGTVATNLSFKVKAREQIGKRLNNTAKDVEENALKMTSMGSGLTSAMEQYDSNERKIIEKAASLSAVDLFIKQKNILKGTQIFLEAVSQADAINTIARVLRSGFNIYQKGDYYIVNGLPYSRQGIDGLENISGTRYRIGSEAFLNANLDKYLPIGQRSASNVWDKWKSNAANNLSGITLGGICKDAFYIGADKRLLQNIGTAAGYLSVVASVGGGILENYENGASGSKYAADIAVDTLKGLGGMAVATGCAQVGAAIGTAIPIPVVGTVVGAVAGFAIGWIGNQVYEYIVDGLEVNGKTLAEHVSGAIESGIDFVGDKLNEAKDAVGNFFGGFGESVAAWSW